MKENERLKDEMNQMELEAKELNLKICGKTYENSQLKEEIKYLNSLGCSCTNRHKQQPN